MKRLMMENLLRWKEKKDRKPLIIKGVRQVGKTYLLKEFGKTHFPKYHYLNFEKEPILAKIFEADLSPQRILTELSFHLNSSIDVARDLVIFDEIQELPKALTSLKYFCEDCPELHICAAGSLLGVHLSLESFPVGKVTFQALRPMSFEEFLWAVEDERSLQFIRNFSGKEEVPEVVHAHLWDQLKRYFVVGGLPEVVAVYVQNRNDLFKALSLVREKQEDLVKSYYADISKHSGKVNAMHINRILESVPSQIRQVHEESIARFRFRGVVPGVSHYDRLAGAIDWLETAGLVIKVPVVNTGHSPFSGYAKENFFKLLLFDIGILGSMSGLSPKNILEYEYRSYKGYFAENFVAEELLGCGVEKLFSWQEGQAELEFLLELEGKVIPLEVKSGSNIKAKSLKSFSEKYKPAEQIILSGRSFSINKSQGIYYYPLYLAGKLLSFKADKGI